MSTSTSTVRASTSVSTTPQFWERLWRSAGVQSVGLFVIAYFVYGNQLRTTWLSGGFWTPMALVHSRFVSPLICSCGSWSSAASS